MAKLETIKCIGQEYLQLLRETCQINSVAGLLRAGDTPDGRCSIADAIGVEVDVVKQWVHQADLVRIKGVGREYVGLLDTIGVKTLNHLRQHTPETLYHKLEETNGHHHLVRRLPTPEMVTDWLEQANELSPTIPE